MIQIYKWDIAILKEKILEVYKEKKKKEDTNISKKSIDVIKNILSNREIMEMFTSLQDKEFVSKLSFIKLAKVEESAKILAEELERIKKQVELDEFLSKGYNLNIEKLKKEFIKKKLRKSFPNLNFDKIRELYLYPPKKLPTYYDENKYITIDAFVFRKYLIGIIQMIFNHMDLVVCIIGDEGAGKSCKCSQDMFILWWLMKELGIIDYPFNINEIFVNTLRKFSELEDKYYGVPFRILGLDEGNELNRQDWKEDDVKLFWQRLRRERHEQRIKFINIPVLGEMIINIVLSRINFIFNMRNKNKAETGTLYKGDYDFYIIPRGDKIFSPFLSRELSKEEIKNKLYLNLKDKSYLKGIPKDIKIKTCHCNGVWGFAEKDYIKELKETNKQYTITKGLKFGTSETFAFYKSRFTPAKVNISKDSVFYPSLNKMIHKIKSFWNNDPELLTKYTNIFKQKQEEKDNDGRKPTREKPRDKYVEESTVDVL